jgi:rabenosyn-5
MSTGRTLGRGRVLGSAQTLSPLTNASPRPQHKRNTSLLSPSESSVSLNSQLSNSPASTIEQHDLTANVSLGTANNAAVAAASSRLVCPICNEEMVGYTAVSGGLEPRTDRV